MIVITNSLFNDAFVKSVLKYIYNKNSLSGQSIWALFICLFILSLFSFSLEGLYKSPTL